MGINVVELIRLVRSDLLEVGGHPMAAGFGLLTERIELVRGRLHSLAKEQISAEMLEPTVKAECELDFSLLNLHLPALTQKFEPFGQGNPKPIFKVTKLLINDIQILGKTRQHLKITLTDQDQKSEIQALGWNLSYMLPDLQNAQSCEVCVTAEVNTWKQRSSLQLVIKGIKTETLS